jgi:hypothetical protein
MARTSPKIDIYPLEAVEKRITFYKQRELELNANKGTKEALLINKNLLSFWITYKSKNYGTETGTPI